MEVLREIINSDKLKSLFTVPKSMENMEVEVIVLPLMDKGKMKSDVDAALKSITGVIRDEGMTLEDYRKERLEKYAGIKSYLTEAGAGDIIHSNKRE